MAVHGKTMKVQDQTTPLPPALDADAILACRLALIKYFPMCVGFSLAFMFFVLILPLLFYFNPVFYIESVSISTNNSLVSSSHGFDDQPVTADWDLGLSIFNRNIRRNLNFTDNIDVLIRCSSLGWMGGVIPPFVQKPRNVTYVNTTISAAVPFHGVRGSVLDFEVLVRARFNGYRIQALCKDMRVGFSENATQGLLLGGSKRCHVESCDDSPIRCTTTRYSLGF